MLIGMILLQSILGERINDFCRRYPPIGYQCERDKNFYSRYPLVWRNGWCGEFAGKME